MRKQRRYKINVPNAVRNKLGAQKYVLKQKKKYKLFANEMTKKDIDFEHWLCKILHYDDKKCCMDQETSKRIYEAVKKDFKTHQLHEKQRKRKLSKR